MPPVMELEKVGGLHHGERVEREPIRGSGVTSRGALKISRRPGSPTIPTLLQSIFLENDHQILVLTVLHILSYSTRA